MMSTGQIKTQHKDYPVTGKEINHKIGEVNNQHQNHVVYNHKYTIQKSIVSINILLE